MPSAAAAADVLRAYTNMQLGNLLAAEAFATTNQLASYIQASIACVHATLPLWEAAIRAAARLSLSASSC